MTTRISDILKRLEERHVPLIQLIIFWIAVVFLRTYLEVVVGVGKMPSLVALTIHYPMFYLSLLLSLALVLKIFSGEKLEKIIRVLVPAYSIILLPPIIDIILFGPGQFWPKYLFFSETYPGQIIKAFLFYLFKGPWEQGITVGMRVEIIIGVAGTGWYVWHKTGKLWKALLASASAYVLVFCYISQPIFYRLIKTFPAKLGVSQENSLTWRIPERISSTT